MSCFFCNSQFHVSHYCTKYPTDISRKEYARSKNRCEDCMNHFDYYVPPIPQNYDYKRIHGRQIDFEKAFEKIRLEKSENLKSKKCELIQKCIICFSKSHHTVFCPNLNTGPNIFCPTLDKDILPRFLEMFDAYEKCLIASFSPSAAKLLKPASIKIIKDIEIQNNFKVSNIFITNQITIYSSTNNLISIESAVIKAKIVNLSSLKICAYDFLQLLSKKTITLICHNVTLTTTLKFVDIIKAAPNLQNIQIYNSNIEIENTWPEDLLKYKNGNNFKELRLTTFVFNVEALAKFMKIKSEKNVFFNLFINIPNKEFHETIMKKLLKYFEPMKSGQNRYLIVHFQIKNEHPFCLYHFTLMK